MKKYEEKFIVINRKYIPDNKYYVCNQDEPYAEDVIQIILTDGEHINKLRTKIAELEEANKELKNSLLSSERFRIEDAQKTIQLEVEVARLKEENKELKSTIVKVAIDYGIVEIKQFDGKFYFEKQVIK